MIGISEDIINRKKMELFVDTCRLETADEVARLFRDYTLLIWDYLLVGKISDFYPDGIILNTACGGSVQGIDTVYSNTLAILANIPQDNETLFIDIFAEGDKENGYSFCQATSNYVPSSHGGKSYTPPEGRIYSDDQVGSIGLCECRVEKLEGKWKIVEEWLVRTPVPPRTE